MSAFTDFLVGTLTGTIQTIGESKLESILQDLHDSNETDYKATIALGVAFFAKISPLVEKSKNKIDDAILGAMKDAVEKSAKLNGVDITVPESTDTTTTATAEVTA